MYIFFKKYFLTGIRRFVRRRRRHVLRFRLRGRTAQTVVRPRRRP